MVESFEPQTTHETLQEVLYRDIEKYRKHIEEQKKLLTAMRKDFEATRNQLTALREQMQAEPDNNDVRERYAVALDKFAKLNFSLFEDEENIRLMQELPELEAEVKTANAAFLRALN